MEKILDAKIWDTKFLRILIPVVIGFLIIYSIKKVFKKRAQVQKNLHERYLAQLMELVVIIVCLIDIAGVIDETDDLTTMLIRGSALIVAILGFAAQTAISDIICGFLISIFKPFEIGDRIIVEGQDPGIVEDITLRHTILKIYDDLRIILPNSQLNAKTLINTSYKNKKRRGVHLQFSVSYDTDIQKAIDIIRDCVAESPYTLMVENNGIIEDSGPVYFLKFADSALILDTTIFINRNTSSYIATTDINLRVNNAFKENGIEIPYNYLNVIQFEGEKAVVQVDDNPDKTIKKKTSPSKRHYRTNTVRLLDNCSNITEAVEVADLFSKKQRLEPAAKMQLELLTEETIGIISSIVEGANTSFWIEGSGLKYRIHVSFSAKLDSAEYKKLINLSSSGKNEASKGFTARIWDIMIRGLNDTQNSDNDKNNNDTGTGYNWSLSEADEINEEEISESILGAIADDIKVSVTKDRVDFMVIKSLQSP
ncbi:MAG: mechanosensitive ion channel family protein [Lachnospiraceae bacterium]|nr:mechanosensitive ion channel family protein [Lachnospiraceae bacterium]